MMHKVLHYDMNGAYFSGVDMHPQLDMKRLGLSGYYNAIPAPIGDCWFFCFKEWPEAEIPSYIYKQEIDDDLVPGFRLEKEEEK